MANHVFSYIEFYAEEHEKQDDLCKHIESLLTEDIKNKSYDAIHHVLEAFGHPEVTEEQQTRSWYTDTIGAKWCHAEDFSEATIATNSAWSAPIDFARLCCELLSKDFPGIYATVEFEDEMPNFIGSALVTAEEIDDVEEIEYSEIVEAVKEKTGRSEVDDDEFGELLWDDDVLREEWYEYISRWKSDSSTSQAQAHVEWIQEMKENNEVDV